MLGRGIDVDDELDGVDVDAAGGDVCGHEHLRLTIGERGEVAIARTLRQVAVQVDGGDSGCRELAGEALGPVLRAGEEDAAARAGGELVYEFVLVVDRHLEHVVGHGRNMGGRLIHGVEDLVVEETTDELVDVVVQGGGEEHPLSLSRGLVEDSGDSGQEPEVSHVVSLVEDGDLDVLEREDVLLEQVLEAARAGHDDIDAGLECDLLSTLLDAAEDRRRPQAHGLGQRVDDLGDLRGELTGGGKDESARMAEPLRTLAGFGQASDERNGERQGLAGPGLSAAEHITAGQRVGQSVLLDREGLGLAFLAQRVDQFLGDTELGKSGRGWGGLLRAIARGVGGGCGGVSVAASAGAGAGAVGIGASL